MTTHTHQLSHDLRPLARRQDRAVHRTKRSRADRALIAGFVTAAVIHVIGLWQLVELRNPGGGPTPFGTAAWAGLLAFNAVVTVGLFFTMAYRATAREQG